MIEQTVAFDRGNRAERSIAEIGDVVALEH
jgi:hypothetical protein